MLPSSANNQKWAVIAAFFNGDNDRWLDDYLSDSGIAFEKIASPTARRDWHLGKSKLTSIAAWVGHLRHARLALARKPAGVIACFPQLAICAALFKRIGRHKPPIIAYNFNLGKLRTGLRQRLAQAVAGQIDCFVVHSPEEVSRYTAYLGLPAGRVQFVPLQRGKINTPRAEDNDSPFVLAMGSAHRDYPTLIAAVDRLKIPTVIITRKSDIAALATSPYVTFRSELTEQECIAILARARVCATPIANMTTASGQITFINAMQLGVPVVATQCPGTDGYVTNGVDGLLVAPFDEGSMCEALDAVWSDAALRDKLSQNAMVAATARFSDQAAAATLAGLLRDVTAPGPV